MIAITANCLYFLLTKPRIHAFSDLKSTGAVANEVFFFVALLLAGFIAPPVLAQEPACEQHDGTQLWISPLNPKAGETVKIMAVSTDGPLTKLATVDNQGQRSVLQSRHRGGPPWSLVAELAESAEGLQRIEAYRDGKLAACHEWAAGKINAQERLKEWNLAAEAFYSAWIETLFGAPPTENLSFTSLQPGLRNAERNFLHNYLGQ
ncbi:MAG: hypothetical protein KGN35_10820, partial [Betaproteobacteria bacterium]|nr:hypothetical protein [Betaproteobacteria bacterium]